MHKILFTIGVLLASLLLLASCAATPESALAESRKQAVEADIDDILSYAVDATEVGETKRCLSDNAYRSYRALGDRHLLFEGRRDKQWINVLRSRCRDLRYGDVFIITRSSGAQMCNLDHFQVADPLTATTWRDLGTGATCSLGEFKPVTKSQVEEIEKRLESL